MAAVGAWFRLDLRRRWRSLLVLTLLIALAAGTVMTAVAGARRGATAVDRLLASTLPATVVAQPNQPGFDWDAVRALPEVEALAEVALSDLVIDELPDGFYGYPIGGDEAMRAIERPVVLEGRLPDPDRPDELAIGPVFANKTGFGVGDTLTLRLFDPETQDQLVFAEPGAFEPDGPVVKAQIVGVVRSPGQLLSGDEAPEGDGGLLTSPALLDEYAANLLGASGEGIVNAAVRLRAGEAAIPEFTAALKRLTGRPDIGVWNLTDEARRVREATDFESDALLVFALAAAAAAMVLVGQAVTRLAAAAVVDLPVLRALGMAPRQVIWAATVGPLGAAVIGTAVGTAGAVAISSWFPIGMAGMYEPDPGFHIDPLVVTVCAVVVPVAVAVAAAGGAGWALRSSRRTPSGRRSAVVAAAARWGAPVPIVVGGSFALELGRGPQAVAVRPALVGAVAGIGGVLAALTFSAGVADAADHPERFGQVHQLDGFVGFDGEEFVPMDQLLPALTSDPDVISANSGRIGVADVGAEPVTLYTLDSVGAPWRPVLVEGRPPETDNEIALAPRSAEVTGASVGDVIQLTGTGGQRELTVTGVAFVPEFQSHNNYVTGGWVTAHGFDELFDSGSELSPAFKFHLVYLALAPGADPQAVAARLEEATGTADFLFEPGPPSPVAQIRRIAAFPVFLAGFLAMLALGAVGNAVATAVRRRRHDLAVLRAVGMTRAQSRTVVVTQATVLAVVGLALGVPLGMALGRTVWRYVAETTPLFYVPPIALLAVLMAVPVALLAANLLAAWPGHRAASMRVSHVLRTE
jgi:ABC-type lipoprotein release transport system permease subunit